jgi:hypothetical protein
LPLLFLLSFPKRICFFVAVAVAVVVAVAVAVAVAFWLSFPQGICFCCCRCCCRCFSCCHSRRESAFAVAVAVAFLVVIPEGNLLLLLPLPLLFFPPFPQENLFTTKLQEPCNKGTPSADRSDRISMSGQKRWELIEISVSSFADNYEQKAHNRFQQLKAATTSLRACKRTTHIEGQKGAETTPNAPLINDVSKTS